MFLEMFITVYLTKLLSLLAWNIEESFALHGTGMFVKFIQHYVVPY